MAETQETQLAERRNNDSDWIIPIQVMLRSINHEEVQGCGISTISDRIRSTKEEAYSPKAVSLGPLHNAAKKNLQLMEELKWRFTLSFLARAGETAEEQDLSVRRSAEAMRMLDNVVRASYGGLIKFEPQDLARIMLVDGCFVLEFLIRLNNFLKGIDLGDYSFIDPLFKNEEKFFSVLNDLTMLENQVPYIVLKTLYKKVFPSGIAFEDDHRVADLALSTFGYNSVHSSGIAHLLHLIHSSIVDSENRQVRRACNELKRCATSLQALGIILQSAKSNMRHCRFVNKFEFNIELQGEKLEVPPLCIKETTEATWRNLIAWEQNRIGIRPKFTSYALFFQGLICCEHDIELLLKTEIIINDVRKSKEELLTFFRTITEGVEYMDSTYSELCETLKYQPVRVSKVKELSIITWHGCRFIFAIIRYGWQNWYNILRREHIPTVWKLIGIMAAMLLVALNILQSYYAAKSRK